MRRPQCRRSARTASCTSSTHLASLLITCGAIITACCKRGCRKFADLLLHMTAQRHELSSTHIIGLGPVVSDRAKRYPVPPKPNTQAPNRPLTSAHTSSMLQLSAVYASVPLGRRVLTVTSCAAPWVQSVCYCTGSSPHASVDWKTGTHLTVCDLCYCLSLLRFQLHHKS